MKIGIIHHSNKKRDLLRQVVTEKSLHKVAWTTNYGEHAVDLSKKERPDLILLDEKVCRLEGYSFLLSLKSEFQTLILILSPKGEKNTTTIMTAMGYGVIDLAYIPDEPNPPVEEWDGLLQKLTSFSSLLTYPLSKKRSTPAPNEPVSLVLMGASTGGPVALKRIFSQIPEESNASFVIIQHVEEEFNRAFSVWLGERLPLPLKLVEQETIIMPGTIYLSGPSRHLIITPSKTLCPWALEKRNHYLPSIDVLFESAAKNWTSPSVAILLTGMGTDGAKGLKELRDKGWHTIAESEESAVVFGMPKAAIEMKAAVEIMDLSLIPMAIVAQTKLNRGGL